MKTLHTIYTSFAKRLVVVLALLTLGVTSAWAQEEELVYTLDGTVTGGTNGYDTESTITQSNISWSIKGNTLMEPWRIGGKSLTNVERAIYSTTAINDDISKIVITHGTASSITVNSMTVIVSTIKNGGGTVISTLTPTFSANGDVTITRPDGKDWSKAFYKIVYNVTVSSTSNKFIEFTSAKFYKTTAPSTFTVTCKSNNASYGTVSQASVTNVANNTSISANGNQLTIGSTTITATPNAQDADYTYAFKEWSGIPTGGKVTENVTVTANFTRTARDLTNYRTTCATETTYSVTSTLSHVTAAGGNPKTVTSEDEDLTLTYLPEDGWNLPVTISVTMGGAPLSSETDYDWDNGDLLIAPESGFTGDIVVTINGWQQLAHPSGLNVSNITSSSATLLWGAVANAEYYKITVKKEGNIVKQITADGTTCNVTELAAGTEYTWCVYAVADGYTDSEEACSSFETKEELTDNCRWVEIALEDITPEDEIVVTMGNDKTVFALGTEKITNSPKSQEITITSGMIDINQDFNYSKYTWSISTVAGGYQLQPYGTTQYLYGVASYITISSTPTTFSIFTSPENGNKCFMYTIGSTYYLGHGAEDGQTAWKRVTTYDNLLKSNTLKFYKKTCLPANKFWIDYELANITCTTNPTPSQIDQTGEDLLLEFSANDGYKLPESISVSIGNNILPEDNDVYIWNSETGELLIYAAQVTDNITITIEGCEQLAAPENLLATNITSTSAVLSWVAVAKADEYIVFVTDGETNLEIPTTNCTITIEGLSKNTYYLWDVTATADNYCDSKKPSVLTNEFTTRDVYTVTFNYQGKAENTIQNVDAGSNVERPADPTTTGYTFGGWYTEPTCTNLFDFNTEITANTTLYAKWTEWSYTITYAKGSPADEITGEHAPGTKMYTSAVTIAGESFFRLGYKQTGWSKTDGGQKDYDLLGIYGTNENVTLYPYWTKVHTITWMADGSAHDEATYLDGETLALPDTVPEACQGSAFKGWTAAKDYFNATTAPTYVTAGSAVNDNATYYAVYANLEGDNTDYSNTYTSNVAISGTDAKVVINSGQYDAIKAGTTKNAGSVEITIPAGTTKLCFHMAGWNGENGKTISLSGATAKPASFATVADEGISGSGTTYTLKGNVEKYVYSTELTNITEETTITLSNGGGNQRFVVWGVNASSASYKNYSTSCSSIYNISYELDGGENGCENGSVTAGGDYNICADEPTKIGYTFKHWTDGTNTYDADATIEDVQKDITLTAVWEANTYEITWWSNGVEYTTTSHTFDTELQLPADPYTCYGAKTFVGWTATSSVNENGEGITYIEESTNPSEKKTYYAVFADVTSNGSGGYDKVTEALDDYSGEYLIVYEAGKKAFNGGLSTLDATSNGIDVTINNNTIESNPTTDAAKFTIAAINDGYSIKSASGKYIGRTANENELDESTSTIYTNTISINNDKSINIIGSGSAYLRYNTDGSRFRYYKSSTYSSQQVIALYKKSAGVTLTNYTTTPTGCPEIVVAESAYVTSANAQSVKVNVPVTANNFTNDMTITAAVEDGNFSVANVSAVADGACTVTLAYKPTSPKTTESANVTLTAKYGENFVTAKSFTVNGRSLPETFAVVAKVGNMWYALPEVGYEAEKHATAYPVEVNDIADPTEVTSAVANNAAWSLRQVYQAQHSNAQHDRYVVSGANVVFENKQNPAKLLNASAQGDKGSNNYLLTSAQYDNYYSTNPGLYEWTPTTTDLETYTLTNVQRTDKQINISTNAVFGLHASDVVTHEVRFLPIQNTYTTLATQVVEWKENSVLVMYNGDPAQTASVSVNGGTVQTATLSAVQKDIAVYELPATGLAANPGQMLKIAIGSEQLLLSIPYIISEATNDVTILGSGKVAERQAVAKVSDLVILKGGTLTADGAKTNSYKFRNVTVYGGGKLVVPADRGFGVNTLTLRIGGVTPEGNYDYVYPEFELNINYDKAFTNTSAVINLDYVTTKSQYYTFVAPFAVETKDIKYPVDIYGSNVEAANRGSFEFQYYDGAARAAGEKGWKVVEEDATNGATLTAHKGYTFYGMPKKVSVNGGTSTRQKFGIHRIPMTVTAAEAINHENSEQNIAVAPHHSEKNINSGWNLIGNPYMSTITGLDNQSIQTGTIVLVDDRWQWSNEADQYNHRFIVFPSNDGEWYYTSQASNATLPAFKNFFVQIAGEEINAISIPFTHRAPSGISARRATYETDKDIELAIVLEKDEANSDQMDFLINDAYGAGFDYNADFTKMMNNTQLNLYGVLMEDNLSFVALDHFTARGSIAIGYQVPSAGEYTLRISDKPYVMLDRIEALYVTDHEMNPAVTTNLMEEDYVFQVGKAEINDTRFTISFGAETNNGNGGDITTDMSEIDIHSQQPQKFLYDGRLYILRDGKVYSATGHEIKTINQ